MLLPFILDIQLWALFEYMRGYYFILLNIIGCKPVICQLLIRISWNIKLYYLHLHFQYYNLIWLNGKNSMISGCFKMLICRYRLFHICHFSNLLHWWKSGLFRQFVLCHSFSEYNFIMYSGNLKFTHDFFNFKALETTFFSILTNRIYFTELDLQENIEV